MKKAPKTLPQAIKIMADKYGKDVVKDVQMVNILNDVVSLEDHNAVKSILRDVVKMGYGKKILDINVPKEDYHLKVKSYSKIISDSLGYNQVLVQYVLFSIAYGIGITSKTPHLKSQKSTKENKGEVQPSQERTNTKGFIGDNKFPIKAVVSFFIILTICLCGLNYCNSSDDREQFKDRLFSGNSFMNEGDYMNAVESYKEAYNGYNAMNSSSYKDEALNKIDEVVNQLKKTGDTDNKSLGQAYKVIESELQLELKTEDKNRLIEKKNNLEEQIRERTENGRNTLIMNLSANNGKLDDNGKKLLGELLELSPNDYWLNFIKNKSYE